MRSRTRWRRVDPPRPDPGAATCARSVVEFWQGRVSRLQRPPALHGIGRWSRPDDPAAWRVSRLWPGSHFGRRARQRPARPGARQCHNDPMGDQSTPSPMGSPCPGRRCTGGALPLGGVGTRRRLRLGWLEPPCSAAFHASRRSGSCRPTRRSRWTRGGPTPCRTCSMTAARASRGRRCRRVPLGSRASTCPSERAFGTPGQRDLPWFLSSGCAPPGGSDTTGAHRPPAQPGELTCTFLYAANARWWSPSLYFAVQGPRRRSRSGVGGAGLWAT